MKFTEIFGGFNLFLGILGKGSCRVSFFLGGGSNPGKRESGDLRLLLDYFLFFFGWQALEKGIHRFEIALGFFLKNFHRRQALKNGVWRFEIALELFFSFFFRRQAMKNAVWRFEIALGLFS